MESLKHHFPYLIKPEDPSFLRLVPLAIVATIADVLWEQDWTKLYGLEPGSIGRLKTGPKRILNKTP